jgi:predicted NAD-dependent protein-ADP-ribosyltransferase YbiA (DUF1768 family)
LFLYNRVEGGGAFLSNLWGKNPGVTLATSSAGKSSDDEGGFIAEDNTFISVEHYYQWKLAGHFNPDYQKKFMDVCATSLGYYKLGKKGYGITKSEYKELNKHVDPYAIMKDAIRYKFSDQNPSLVKALLETKDKVLGKVEHKSKVSEWDVMGKHDVGYNWLGIILMERRSELKEELDKKEIEEPSKKVKAKKPSEKVKAKKPSEKVTRSNLKPNESWYEASLDDDDE